MAKPEPSFRLLLPSHKRNLDCSFEAPNAHQSDQPHDTLHLMPFSIDYDGPAQISTYFLPRPLAPEPTPGGENQSCFEASFRGRYLHGTQLKVPQGYTGIVLSLPLDSCASGPSHLSPISDVRTSNVKRVAGRGRGRGRGRRLGQAVGISQTKNANLKRKASPSNVFLSEDESEVCQITQSDQTTTSSSIAHDKLDSNANGPVSKVSTCPSAAPSSSNGMQSSRSELPVQPGQKSSNAAIQQTAEPSSGGTKSIQAVGSFDHFTIWNPDGPLDTVDDIYSRSIKEWVEIAQLLHTVPSM
ncbi:hypothetical protein O181_074136 [Austropuccinia psidii MF-1]|uniref:Uncharacterized protein n=1 Tax=Austropuccinia psidii MF-1 TaxID=1389203 RepID=A0A9Q3F603_9BASI|nr:hypothetical protein [Austropuccinia psidii MF-1]